MRSFFALVFALAIAGPSWAQGFWQEFPAAYQFPDPVTEGQYTVDVIMWQLDDAGHSGLGGSGTNAYSLAARIDGGPHDNELVFDFFDDSDEGLARLVEIVESLGFSRAQMDAVGANPEMILDWLDGKTFTVNVRTWDTPRFQEISRIDYDGWVERITP